MLPALSKNYCTRANVPFLENTTTALLHKSAMFLLKEALKDTLTTGTFTGTRHANSVWTVVGSSDGVTAALDGVDRWGTTFDPAKIVTNGSSAAHSWIILQNTTLGVQLLIDLNANVTSTSTGRIAVCWSQFTLNVTNPRYSPNGVVNRTFQFGVSGAISPSNTADFIYALTASSTFRMHFTFTDNGQFFWLVNKIGDGSFSGGCVLFKAEGGPNDQYNLHIFGGSATSSDWPSSVQVANNNGCTSIGPTGVETSAAGLMIPFIAAGNLSSSTANGDRVSAFTYFTPVTVWSSVDPMAYRGAMPDCYNMIPGRPGILLPDDTTPMFITVSDFAFPWVGVAIEL